MVQRSKRLFTDTDRRTLLAAIEECRRACVTVSTKAPIAGVEYQAAGKLMQAIDDMAGTLTGDRTHFHSKSHSTFGGPASGAT